MSIYYPVGLYECEVTGQALTESSNGNPQFVLQFKVISKDQGGEDLKQYDRTCYMTITEKTIDFVAEALQVLGFSGSLRRLDPSSPTPHLFRGEVVKMWCAHKPDQNGVDRERWSVSSGPRALKVTPPDPKKLQNLDAMFARASKSLAGPSAQKPRQAAPTTTAAGDDDVPF